MGFVGEYGTPLAHGDMVRGIEADGGDVSEGADLLAVVCGTKSIAAVFDEPKVVLPGKRRDGIDVENVAECMRDDDGFRFPAVRCFKLCRVNLITGNCDVDEDRH